MVGKAWRMKGRRRKIYPESRANINQNISVRKFILFNFDLWKAFSARNRCEWSICCEKCVFEKLTNRIFHLQLLFSNNSPHLFFLVAYLPTHSFIHSDIQSAFGYIKIWLQIYPSHIKLSTFIFLKRKILQISWLPFKESARRLTEKTEKFEMMTYTETSSI